MDETAKLCLERFLKQLKKDKKKSDGNPET